MFFLYTYITDTCYLLVINCCCCLCARSSRGAGSTVCVGGTYPPAHAPGATVASSGQEAKNFSFFFFSLPPDTVLDVWRGERWASELADALFPPAWNAPPSIPFLCSLPTPCPSWVFFWVYDIFSEDARGTSSCFSALALVFVAAWGMEGVVLGLGARKGVGAKERVRK